MSKLKTKSSAKKRFRVTATGKFTRGYAGKRHNLRKRSQNMKRQARGTTVVSPSDQKRFCYLMPYSL